MSTTQDTSSTILNLVGEAGTPLPKIKKDAKLNLRRLRKSLTAIPDKLAIRADILLGKRPAPALLAPKLISASLVPTDALRAGKNLSNITKTVEATALFIAIREQVTLLDRDQLLRLRRRIVGETLRWWNWAKKVGPVDQDTTVNLLSFIYQFIRKASQPTGERNKTGSENATLFRLVEVGLESGVDAMSLEAHVGVMAVLRAVYEAGGEGTLQEVFGKPSNKNHFEQFIKNVGQNLREMALQEQIGGMKSILSAARSVPYIRSRLQEVVEEIWTQNGAELTEELQSILKDFIGSREGPPKLEYVDESEKPEIFQLATALLQAWDARLDGDRAGLAFQKLCSVAKDFFGMWLLGDVGKVTTFNRRLHEPLGPDCEGDVVLVRPRVEMERGGIRKVMIRGLVRKAE